MMNIRPPDFEEMMGVAEEILSCSKTKLLLELDIELREAESIKLIMKSPEYHIKGKTPSMDYIKRCLLVPGLNNELKDLRKNLIDITVRLDRAKLKYDIMKDMLNLYRTESANSRVAM